VDSTGEAREAMARVRARVRVFMEEGGGVLIKCRGVGERIMVTITEALH
jgi:hypothetical protein